MAQIVVRGLPELRRKLFALNDEIKRQIALDGVMDAAEVIRLEAGRQAPSRSGRLKRRIVKNEAKFRTGRGRRTAVAKSNSLVTGDEVAVQVGPSKKAFYGLFVELGWQTKGGKRVPGRRFLGRAFDLKRREAVRVARRKIGRNIKRYVARFGT